MKKLIKRILYPHTYSSEAFISFLRKKGIRIGEGCIVFSPNHVTIDIERPHMLIIGNYCKIASGVRILTHDYSKSVLLNMPFGDVGEGGLTKIGNNTFLGMDAIILMGTKIGDNCIVGAGSVCTGVYPSNSVIAGNPAKVICSIEQYYEKKKKKELASAKEFVKEFRLVFKRDPTIEEMTNSFISLYLPRNKESFLKYESILKHNGIDQEYYLNHLLNSNPIYNSFDDFLRDCDVE